MFNETLIIYCEKLTKLLINQSKIMCFMMFQNARTMSERRLFVSRKLQSTRTLWSCYGFGYRLCRYRTTGGDRLIGTYDHVRSRQFRTSRSTYCICHDTHPTNGTDVPESHVLPSIVRASNIKQTRRRYG